MAADGKSPDPATPGRGGAEIPFHPLVSKLLSDSGEPQDLVTMTGYIGPSKKEAHVRLYKGLDFQSYYEVPREHVVLAEPVDREDDNSPTRLMVRSDATLDLVQTSKQTGPASYLAGAIAGTYMTAASGGQGGIIFPTPTARLSLCLCPTYIFAGCLTRPPICIPNTSPIICPVASGFVCPQDPGGPVEEQAQAQPQAQAYPVSVFCASYAIPCPSHWIHCPSRPCPLPQEAMQAQAAAPEAAMAAGFGYVTAYCRSNYGPCPSHYICGTPQCPMDVMAQPQAQAAAGAGINLWPTIFCRSVLYPCVTHPYCPTRICPVVQAPEQAAPQFRGYPTAFCSVLYPCTAHHGCPTAAVLC